MTALGKLAGMEVTVPGGFRGLYLECCFSLARPKIRDIVPQISEHLTEQG